MVSKSRRDPLTDPLLTPENCVMLLIDYQAPRLEALRSIESDRLIANVIALVETAAHFQLPIILSTAGVEAGETPETWPAIRRANPDAPQMHRTSLNAWEDDDFTRRVRALGRRKLIVGGLWTEGCVALTTLDALRDGYEVLVPVDAVGGTSIEAHQAGLARMFQLGAQPVSCLSILCELQRDWSRAETLQGTLSIGRKQSDAWPLEVAGQGKNSNPSSKCT